MVKIVVEEVVWISESDLVVKRSGDGPVAQMKSPSRKVKEVNEGLEWVVGFGSGFGDGIK